MIVFKIYTNTSKMCSDNLYFPVFLSGGRPVWNCHIDSGKKWTQESTGQVWEAHVWGGWLLKLLISIDNSVVFSSFLHKGGYVTIGFCLFVSKSALV